MDNTTKSYSKFAVAFIEAQKEMVNASKDSTNPHFKSKYADLTSVRDACVPFLNKYKIAVLQPIIQMGREIDNRFEEKQYVKTILLHESGESMECLTEIIHAQNTAQAHGSGITYARRYGLQSLVCIGAEDDDGNAASDNSNNAKFNSKIEVKTITIEQGLEIENFAKSVGSDVKDICKYYKINTIIDLPVKYFTPIMNTLKKKVVVDEMKNENS